MACPYCGGNYMPAQHKCPALDTEWQVSDPVCPTCKIPWAGVERVLAERDRLRAEVARLTQERDDAQKDVETWKVVAQGLNRLAGVVSRIAGTLGLDPDESEEAEVEQRVRAIRRLAGQLVAAAEEALAWLTINSRNVRVHCDGKEDIGRDLLRVALVAAEQAGIR